MAKAKLPKVNLKKLNIFSPLFRKLREQNSLRYIFNLLFVLSSLASLLYIIPTTVQKIGENNYFFKNLPALDKSPDLKLEIPQITNTYGYKLESAASVDNDREWNKLVAEDKSTLERRIQSFLGTNDFEVRLDKVNSKAVFTIFTTRSLGTNTEVFTAANNDFKISAVNSTSSKLEENGTPQKNDLNLNRRDFGSAELTVRRNEEAQEGQSQFIYEVRLPIGLIGADKAKILEDNRFSTINVSVGGKDYTGSFQQAGAGSTVLTTLNLTSAQSIDEASALRTYINTGRYNLGYTVTDSRLYTNTNGVLKLIGLASLFLIAAAVLNYYTLRNLSPRKFLYIIGLIFIALGAVKLFGMVITLGFISILAVIVLLTFFSSPTVYYVGFAGILLLTKLLGYLYYMQLNTRHILLLAVVSLLIWSTNYVKTIDKKHA